MDNKCLFAAVVVAALIIYGTPAAAIDAIQYSDRPLHPVHASEIFPKGPDRSLAIVEWRAPFITYPGEIAGSAIRPVSFGIYFSVGKHDGKRHYRHGNRHHRRHHYHHEYRLKRKHNFYGPSRNFYDSDPGYSYYEKRYGDDHYYRHEYKGRYNHGGERFRHRLFQHRGYGRHHY